MKVVVQSALGQQADALSVLDIEAENLPAPGKVLIDVRLASVHHGDLAQTRSQQSIPDDVGYVRRGSEAVGVVRALAPDVEAHSQLKPGDRVIGFPAFASWAESIVIPVQAVIPVPPEVSDEVAAQLLINYVTARTILRGLRKSVPDQALRDGAVLLTGASTVVARLLIVLLDKEELTSIGLTRSAASAKRVAAEMAGTKLTSTEEDDWQAKVTGLAAGKKIVGVLDCVSGSLVGDLVPLLADEAAIVTYGALGGNEFGIGAADIVGRRLLIRGVTFGRWFAELSQEEQHEDIQSAFRVASELPSIFKVAGVYSLSDFRKAVLAVEAPNRDGFIFIKP